MKCRANQQAQYLKEIKENSFGNVKSLKDKEGSPSFPFYVLLVSPNHRVLIS